MIARAQKAKDKGQKQRAGAKMRLTVVVSISRAVQRGSSLLTSAPLLPLPLTFSDEEGRAPLLSTRARMRLLTCAPTIGIDGAKNNLRVYERNFSLDDATPEIPVSCCGAGWVLRQQGGSSVT